MLKKLITLILLSVITLSVFAKEKTDSVSSHYAVPRSWFLVPAGFYQEETSLGLGLNGGYYFKSKSLDKISSISGSAFYTLLNQVKINLNARSYLADDKVALFANLQLRHYVEHYYGISNDINALVGVDEGNANIYTSQSFDVNIQPFYNFTRNISAGIYFRARGERMVKFNEPLEANVEEYKKRYGDAGWEDYFMWGIGAQFMYDTRDNMFYPQKFSNFLKLNVTTYNKALGSSFSYTGIDLDFRQYIPTWLGQVFAWQVKFETALGSEVPFQMLPTVGGSDNIRGIRDIYNPSIVKPKIGYGAGIRCRINDARVNLRVDFAGNNYGEFKFYITATEAF